MKPAMTHPPTKASRTQAVTHPLRADLAPLEHFRSLDRFSRDFVPFPATHDHHIPYSPELSLIAPINSDS